MKTTYQCPRCSGTGTVNHFLHVENGVCFLCGGSGQVAKLPKSKIHIPEITKETEFIADKVIEMLKAVRRVENNGIYYMKSETFEDTFVVGNEYGDHGTSLLGLKLHIQTNNFTI